MTNCVGKMYKSKINGALFYVKELLIDCGVELYAVFDMAVGLTIYIGKDWFEHGIMQNLEEGGNMTNNLAIAKMIIRKYFTEANCGIFNCRNFFGDPMKNLYKKKDGLTIDICYYYSYFEVFGLSNDEFNELNNYYESLGA